MDAGVWEIFGIRYYTHGFGLIFVLPFVIWFFVASVLTLKGLLVEHTFKWRGLLLSAFLIVVTLVTVFWDVYQIGQQATKLCQEQGGLHVYKIAEAEGFIGDTSIEYWSKYGFKYVEYKYASGKLKSKKIRFIMKNNKPINLMIEDFKSQYKLVITSDYSNPNITIHRYVITNIINNNVLGEAVKFGIRGGWADMLFFGITGFNYSPWICSEIIDGHILNPGDIVKATLKPIRKSH